MPEGIIDVVLRAPSGSVQTLRVTEVISIDGKPFNVDQMDDLQSVFQAIRHLEGRIEANEKFTIALIQNSLTPEQINSLTLQES